MSTRGKSNVFADAFEVDDFVSIGETQQPAGRQTSLAYLPTISLTFLGLQKTRDRLDAHLQSTALKLRLLLNDCKATKAVLNSVDANIAMAEAEQEGESEIEEDELVEEMVDKEISRAK
jgi:hypothetical protein